MNPLAGLGGAAGLKGSDHPDTKRIAEARGVSSQVERRVREVFETLAPQSQLIEVVMPQGSMGLELDPLWNVEAVYETPASTTAQDTQEVARRLLEARVDLLLFAGGDGTARDIYTVVGKQVPVLGIPAGVKMHSGVFAVAPRAAGSVVRSLIAGQLVAVYEAEVRDIDESAFAQGRVLTRHYGDMLVPDDQLRVQRVKCSGMIDDAIMLEELCCYLCELIEDNSEALWVLGSGGTLKAIKDKLGIEEPTLLGVDIWYQGACVQKDAYESQVHDWVSRAKEAHIVLSVIGGQGVVLGRGNQQVSARVLKHAGIENIHLVATREKLGALESRALAVDSGDHDLNQALSGYRKVICGYEDFVLYPIAGDA